MQSSHEDQVCLRIAVSLPVKGTFSYLVPDRLALEARVGRRILVPFNNRKVTGYALESIRPNEGEKLKEIWDVLDPQPLFPEGLVPFLNGWPNTTSSPSAR